MRDGQGVITEGLEAAFGGGEIGKADKVYKAVMQIAPVFVGINH